MQHVRQLKVVAYIAFFIANQPFTDVDICQKRSVDQKECCGQSDYRDPFPVRMFFDKGMAVFVFGVSSLPFSSIDELWICWISVTGIYTFSSVFAASTLSEGASGAGFACHVINSPLSYHIRGLRVCIVRHLVQQDFASAVPPRKQQ